MNQSADTTARLDSQAAIDLLSELNAIAGGYLKAVPNEDGLEDTHYLVRALAERQRQIVGSLLDALLEGAIVDCKRDTPAANEPEFGHRAEA